MKTGVVQIVLRLLCCAMVLFPNLCWAGQRTAPGVFGGVVPTTLTPGARTGNVNIPGFSGGSVPFVGNRDIPKAKTGPGFDPSGLDNTKGDQGIDSDPTNGTVTVYQNQSNAVINWQSFNIGSDAWVNFNQQGNANWVALNLIWGQSPSYIFGKLSADGRIYLINQNGILFGRSSRVNVNSLLASANNIKIQDFLDNATAESTGKARTFHFLQENYQVTDNPGAKLDPLATVSNQGEITTSDGGYVFLIGPRVENLGIINAPIGQIGLAAGSDVQLISLGATDRAFYHVLADYSKQPLSNDPTFGKAVNGTSVQWEDGRWTGLYADGGMVGMYGATVEQWGVIRSMTAYKNKQGWVELRAKNKVTTGADSSIYLPVNSSTTETVSDTFDIQPKADIGGLETMNAVGDGFQPNNPSAQIELNGSIIAPTGKVTLNAVNHIYMGPGSSIDVSGVVADLPMPIISDFKLNSVELRDAYDQKTGVLPGHKITTTVVAGSTIGDLSGAVLTQDRTALERSIGGAWRTQIDTVNNVVNYIPQTGRISMTSSNGDITVSEGAILNFSGGAINYASGFVNSTMLLSGRNIYYISNAPANLYYDKILGQFEKTYDRFGVREAYQGLYSGGGNPLTRHVEGYTKGGDAGTLDLYAKNIFMSGRLDGSVTQGVYQNSVTMQGSFTGVNAQNDYYQALLLSAARGLETPRAGTLEVGYSGNDPSDLSKFTADISIVADKSSQSLSPDSISQAVLSAKMLNDASLGAITLNATQTVKTAADASIFLQAGGSFSAAARRIEQEGQIQVPAGSITMNIEQQVTSHTNNGATNINYVPLDAPERIVLGSQSRLDVSGERIDNTPAGHLGKVGSSVGQTWGGAIVIQDATDEGEGVFIKTGAVVDVSGGYTIDPKGKITGGNAGALSIQGSNIMLGGDLRGYALGDVNGKILGGSLTLTSKDIHVAAKGDDWSNFNPTTDNISDSLKGKLYLAGNRFDNTGFTQIKLNSRHDVTIESNTTITTSLVRLNDPRLVSSDPDTGMTSLIRLADSTAYQAGPSSFTAAAGVLFAGAPQSANGYLGNLGVADLNAKLCVSNGAAISTAPAVSAVSSIANGFHAMSTGITLNAPTVIVEGKLESPGGSILVTATGTGDEAIIIPGYADVVLPGSIVLTKDSSIVAKGYNRPDPASTPKRLAMNYLPVDGGSVTLSASDAGGKVGIVQLDEGSQIDISGSEAVENRMLSENGTISSFRNASNPGSLSLTYATDLIWKGTLKADRSMPGLQGAALSISRTDATAGMDVKEADIKRYLSMGFDALTLKSSKSVVFDDVINATIGRTLTLDAPVLQGAGQVGQNVILSAPWIVLTNSTSSKLAATQDTRFPTESSIIFSGQWIDVIGDIQFSGFQDVTLKSAQDIRLSQALYGYNDNADANTHIVNSGKLAATGNITLDADRIYPGNYYSYKDGSKVIYPDIYSDYTVQADGKLTIQGPDQHAGDLIYSAGGNLTFTGKKGIEVRNGGFVAAPLGTITLSSPAQRIYIADGAILTTAGDNRLAINFGAIDDNNLWVVEPKDSPSDVQSQSTYFTSSSLPQKGITIDSGVTGETILMTGSQIDVSGGGSLFAFKFQPSIAGSVDPLTKAGRYIVVKDNGVPMPGQSVYLTGGGGLSSGYYTLIPLGSNNTQNARYAFIPGAYILEVQYASSLPGTHSLSKDGYNLTVGYTGFADTSILSTRPQVYSVRTATDVLTEGHYEEQSFTSGDAGDIAIKGSTTVIGGTLLAKPLSDAFQGGKIALSGTNVIVKQMTGSILPSSFDFNKQFADTDPLKDTLTLSADSLSGKGFREVSLGDATGTSTLTIEGGTSDNPTIISANIISLAAKNNITIGQNAQLNALTDKDKISGEGVVNLTTPGTLFVDANAKVHATHNIILDVNNVDNINGNIQGNLLVNDSAITLKSTNIFFGSESGRAPKDNNGNQVTDVGLYLTQGILDRFAGFQDITFAGKKDIQFRDNFTISAANSITLDSQRIVSTITDGTSVTIAAPTVNLTNSYGESIQSLPTTNVGTFTVQDVGKIRVSQINVGNGDVLFGGFQKIALSSHGDVTAKGAGSLTTGNADLQIKAARITTAADTNADETYQAPSFHAYTGGNYYKDFGMQYPTDPTKYNPNPVGTITFTNSGDNPSTAQTAGGTLEFWGKSIQNGTINTDNTITEHGTIIKADGGVVTLVATGTGTSDGIFMHDGAQILAQGTNDGPGGKVTLRTDDGSVALDANSIIDVSGKQLPVGAVLNVANQLDAGSVTLVAPTGGVAIYGVLKGSAGELKDSMGNTVSKGRGGSFALHTNQIPNFAGLTDLLTTKRDLQGNVISGGFTESIDLRSLLGSIDISGRPMQAHHVKVTADGGDINVVGTIDVSAYKNTQGQEDTYSNDGGTAELYAKNNLNVTGLILASSSIGSGGDVILSSSSSTGIVNLNGTVDVSGLAGGTANGTVYFRAQRNSANNDINITVAQNSIKGARTVYAEAFTAYDVSNTPDASTAMANAINQATNFYAGFNNSSLSSINNFHLLPGIELLGSGDIKWSTDWEQTSTMKTRFGSTAQEPGVLTILAGGNLDINNTIADHPTADISTLASSLVRNSWGFNLVAGASVNSVNSVLQQASADYMAVNRNVAGNLNIADQTVVYTESAPIRFASGGDTTIGSGRVAGYMINNTMGYSLASYDGVIQGSVGRDLIINGGAIQTATGSIGINVGRDLQLNTVSNTLGAIRTTGQLTYEPIITGGAASVIGNDKRDPAPVNGINLTSTDSLYSWRFADGGDITLDVGGNAGSWSNDSWTSATKSDAWDYFTFFYTGTGRNKSYYDMRFSANYQQGTAGLATMGGGDLFVRTGGDFFAQAGTFGSGNLAVYSGGDIKGRFLNTKGQGATGMEAPGHGEIQAMGNFGSATDRTQIELFDSQMAITALGEIQVGAVLNPTLASSQVDIYRNTFVSSTYSEDASISLKAGGDVTIAGKSPIYDAHINTGDKAFYATILPATVSLEAGRNITLLNNFTLASSPTGNLSLFAAGDISGHAVLMSDIAPDYWYGTFYIKGTSESGTGTEWLSYRAAGSSSTVQNMHGFYKPTDAVKQATDKPLHSVITGDSAEVVALKEKPIEIHADGDIKDLKLYLPKKSEVTAKGDILDITYEGQNVSKDDVSRIQADGNISVKYVKSNTDVTGGLIQGGPGAFFVQAGGSIDLGSLPDGIQTIGNSNNVLVGTDNSTLVVLSGYRLDNLNTTDDVEQFFTVIRQAGDQYASFMSSGKLVEAANLLQTTRAKTITPFLVPTGTGNGDINMTSSQISTSIGKSDIFIITSGNLNLGKTALPSGDTVTPKTGITTTGGGAINIFAQQDVNVNESRIMTFLSSQDVHDNKIAYGDITVWSDQGSINAGRGSRTAVSASAPKILADGTKVYSPPAVGSGIRAATYGDNPPPAGDIHLFAPSGIIDAGEAEISGGRIVLAALKVNNAANIVFTSSSVGVPQASSATASIGTLSGVGTVTPGSQLTSDVSSIAGAKERASSILDDIIPKWLDVKVIDFIENE